METYCLIEGSYYVNMNQTNLPQAGEILLHFLGVDRLILFFSNMYKNSFLFPSENKKKIIYYQWIPFIVLSLAAALYFPRLLWRIYQKRSGSS